VKLEILRTRLDCDVVNDKKDSEPASYKRFRQLTKRVVSVPKSEVDKRASEHKAKREVLKAAKQ
jgi:hypothetical protein